MQFPSTCRILLETEPNAGSWNMAVDEALLESAIEDGTCTLRIYRWSEATVSLGYFQNPREAQADDRFALLPVVRRLSGGGAILHHHELTYSCTVPAYHPLASDPVRLYDRVHEQIMAVLGDLGIAVAMRGAAKHAADDSFLCFGRGDQRDIVLAGQKIVGSAQRRRRGAVLQHGSLLLSRSRYASEFPGLADLRPDIVLPGSLAHDLSERIAMVLGESSHPGQLSAEERDRAASLERGRYLTLDWGTPRTREASSDGTPPATQAAPLQ